MKATTKFWKPGTVGPGVDVERETEGDLNFVPYNPHQNMSMKQQRMMLPVFACRKQILYAVEKYRTVIVMGQTGSGKTTQVPQYLHEAGWTAGNRVVGCTQPRRVAAATVATRVAEEMNVQVGQEVGYSIRFDDNSDPIRTRIKYLTDGMLLRETMLDPLLSKYSVLMMDEAHERTLATDILLGLLKKIMRKRKDLRVVVSSATLDAEAFKEFFEENKTQDAKKDTAVILSVEGRQYPVEILYSKKPVRNYLKAAIDTCFHIHQTQPKGDILVFLTGRDDIEHVVQELNNGPPSLRAVPMYSGLSAAQQLKAFRQAEHGTRKVVVSTNVAETSVTIPGIVYVVDSGFVKINSFDPQSNMESLLVTPISQAQANQRTGRAGRVEAGVSYRLYTEDSFLNVLAKRTVPEIQRTNLANVVLQLKALGIDDVLHFDFMSPPPVPLMASALEVLYATGALDEYCKLTKPIGSTLAEFPVEPRLAKMLLASGEMGCSEEILSIAAMLSVQSVFLQPKNQKRQAEQQKRKLAVYEGDHLTLLNVYDSFILNNKDGNWCQAHYVSHKALRRASEIRAQLARYLKKFKIPLVSCAEEKDKVITIRKCIVKGFFMNAAQLQNNGRYKSVRGSQELLVHPSSVLFQGAAQWVIFHDVVQTTEKFMRELTVIEPMWLSTLAPQFYEYKSAAEKTKTSSDKPDSISSTLDSGGATSSSELSEESGQPRKKHRVLF